MFIAVVLRDTPLACAHLLASGCSHRLHHAYRSRAAPAATAAAATADAAPVTALLELADVPPYRQEPEETVAVALHTSFPEVVTMLLKKPNPDFDPNTFTA